MARIRYLKPDFFKDEDLAMLPLETRLFFAGLWCLADKAGRLEDRAGRLKIEIFPYDDIDIEQCLQQLAKPKKNSGQPFINRYETDKQRYIQIINWDKHQKPHHTEKESQIPPTTPLMEKGMGMGMEKQLKASTRLSNGDITVKQLNTHTTKNLQTQTIPLLNNGGVTVKRPLNKQYAEKEVEDACIMNGIPESNAQVYYDHFNAQGWVRANGQPIKNLQSHIKRMWDAARNRWVFDEGKNQTPPPKRNSDGLTPRQKYLKQQKDPDYLKG